MNNNEQRNKPAKKKPRIIQNLQILVALFIMIKENKKWWLLPLLFVLALLSLFVSLAGSQSILPAIYALFQRYFYIIMKKILLVRTYRPAGVGGTVPPLELLYIVGSITRSGLTNLHFDQDSVRAILIIRFGLITIPGCSDRELLIESKPGAKNQNRN